MIQKRIFIILFIPILFIIILKVFYLSNWFVKSESSVEVEAALTGEELLRTTIWETVEEYGIQKSGIQRKGQETIVKIPIDLSPILICQKIISKVHELGGEIVNTQEDLKTGELTITIGYKGQILERLIFIPGKQVERKHGKIAIIVDDFGYSNNGVAQDFLNLPQPVTISIIPGLDHSLSIAEQAIVCGKEIIIHLPMEPLEEKVVDHGFTIMTTMSDQQIRERVNKALREIPNARGVNNHQGSRATADERVMSIVLRELKKNGYYFVDSRTNPISVAYDYAQKIKLPSGENKMFLDVEDGEELIRRKLRSLATIASKRGSAIGIAHVREKTLKVLQEELPRLERMGYTFVPASEVVQ